MAEPNCQGLRPPADPFVKLPKLEGGSRYPSSDHGSRSHRRCVTRRLRPSEMASRTPLLVPICGDDRRIAKTKIRATHWRRIPPRVDRGAEKQQPIEEQEVGQKGPQIRHLEQPQVVQPGWNSRIRAVSMPESGKHPWRPPRRSSEPRTSYVPEHCWNMYQKIPHTLAGTHLPDLGDATKRSV